MHMYLSPSFIWAFLFTRHNIYMCVCVWWDVNDQKMTRNMSCITIDPMFIISLWTILLMLSTSILEYFRIDHYSRSWRIYHIMHVWVWWPPVAWHPCPCHEHGMLYVPLVWKQASPSPSLSRTCRGNEINLAVSFWQRMTNTILWCDEPIGNWGNYCWWWSLAAIGSWTGKSNIKGPC